MLTRYIHLNPIKIAACRKLGRAARVRRLEAYAWSSYPVRRCGHEPWTWRAATEALLGRSHRQHGLKAGVSAVVSAAKSDVLAGSFNAELHRVYVTSPSPSQRAVLAYFYG